MLVALQWVILLLPFAVVAAVILRARSARTAGEASGRAAGEASGETSAVYPEGPVLRWRCENCHRGWFSRREQASDSRLVLVAKRRARRRARALERIEPAWARATGSTRCPSCLSTDIRLSSRQ